MKRFPEPAALDNTGATWQAGGTYSITEGAKRYEFYEKSFAAVVRPARLLTVHEPCSSEHTDPLGSDACSAAALAPLVLELAAVLST